MIKRALVLGGALALAGAVSSPTEAASRTWCLCNGKESGRLHHRFACEYHFKKPGRWPAVGAPSQASATCTDEEWAQFRTYLCVEGRCTYEYVKSSGTKVPLGAK